MPHWYDEIQLLIYQLIYPKMFPDVARPCMGQVLVLDLAAKVHDEDKDKTKALV